MRILLNYCILILLLLYAQELYSQPKYINLYSSVKANRFKLKFSVDIHAGATVDITGNFNGTGYNAGGGLALQTSEHLEVFGDLNTNFVKESYNNISVNFNDYSFGLRIYIGKELGSVRPFIETAIGVYPNFRDFKDYKGTRGGLNLGFGVVINAGNNIGVILRPKLHLAVITGGHPGGGFYVYNGFYGGLRYSF